MRRTCAMGSAYWRISDSMGLSAVAHEVAMADRDVLAEVAGWPITRYPTKFLTHNARCKGGRRHYEFRQVVSTRN